MPRCIQCDETYAENLRRCPHCGATPTAQELAIGRREQRKGGLFGRSSLDRRLFGLNLRRWLLLTCTAVGLGVLALGVAVPHGASESVESSKPAFNPGEWSAEAAAAALAPPDAIVAGKPEDGFIVDVAESDGHVVFVAGRISPLGVMKVTVDGATATISPRGEMFTARIPARSGAVEVVAIGITGATARLLADIVGATAPASGDALRVSSHAAESTVHVATLRLDIEGGPGGRTVQEVPLDRLHNEILIGGKRFHLYRAPEGLVYLRTTAKGQRTFLREIDGQEMVLVPGGVGRRGMGDSPPYGPAHLIRLPPFLIDRSEVNGAQYAAFLEHMARTNDRSLSHPDDPGRDFRPEGWTSDDCRASLRAMPVTGITWYAAHAFARWAGGYLPSEAQWEYAAAGPTGLVYPWGDEMDDARCSRNSIGPVPTDSNLVGEGPFSLLHMCGNVREWCDDRFDPRWYERCSRTNPRGPSQYLHRVVRGGSFTTGADALRLQHRQHLEPATRLNDVGFRVAMACTLPLGGRSVLHVEKNGSPTCLVPFSG